MKFKKVSGNVDLSGWSLNATDKMAETVGAITLEAVKEVIDLSVKERLFVDTLSCILWPRI